MVTQISPELRKRHAFGFKSAAQLGQVKLVLAGNILFGQIYRGIIHPDTSLTRHLQLQAVADQAVEHLTGECGPLRLGAALLRNLLLRTLQLQAQFIESNGFGVDNRHNEISLLLLALRRLAQAD